MKINEFKHKGNITLNLINCSIVGLNWYLATRDNIYILILKNQTKLYICVLWRCHYFAMGKRSHMTIFLSPLPLFVVPSEYFSVRSRETGVVKFAEYAENHPPQTTNFVREPPTFPQLPPPRDYN